MDRKNAYINAVDVIIAFLWFTIITVLFSMFLLNNSRIDLHESYTVQVSAKVREIPSIHHGLVNNNDVIRFSEHDTYFGKVKSAVYSKSYTCDIDENGKETNIHFYPDLQDISIIIECDASISGDTYIINGVEVNVSDEIMFYVPKFSSELTVTDIEVIE